MTLSLFPLLRVALGSLLGVTVLALVSPGLGIAQLQQPGVLLGGQGPLPPPSSDIDPLLPTGARRVHHPRPTDLPRSQCSQQAPVCVNHSTSDSAVVVTPLLSAMERAYLRLVHVLQLPAPLPDFDLGPDASLDLYIHPLGANAAAPEVWGDPRRQREDRVSAHCHAPPSSSNVDRVATLCVAEALLLGVNAASTPHFRRSIATYLWTLWGTSRHELTELDNLQANPHLSLISRDWSEDSSSSWPMIAHLDRRLGTTPGALPVALLQQSRGVTPALSLQWNNEPDALEVLRQALETEARFGQFFLDFAVQRAFWGSRDPLSETPTLLWASDAARVRFEWALTTRSLPRRVAPKRPIEPMGSTYLWLDIDGRKPKTTLAFRANWEPPGNFRWTLVAMGAQGQRLARFDLPYVRGSQSAERTLPDVEGAVAFLIVGFNLGGVDRAHPFDPDHEPWEPHGYTVYLAEVETASLGENRRRPHSKASPSNQP